MLRPGCRLVKIVDSTLDEGDKMNQNARLPINFRCVMTGQWEGIHNTVERKGSCQNQRNGAGSPSALKANSLCASARNHFCLIGFCPDAAIGWILGRQGSLSDL